MCFRPANLVLNKTCPECGEVSDATVTDQCPACGHDLLSVEPDMPDPNAPGVPGCGGVRPVRHRRSRQTAPEAPGAHCGPQGARRPCSEGSPARLGFPCMTSVPGVPK